MGNELLETSLITKLATQQQLFAAETLFVVYILHNHTPSPKRGAAANANVSSWVASFSL